MSELDSIDYEHPLSGVRSKMVRAHEHLDELDGRIADFMDREPYSVSYERKPDGSDHAWHVHIREHPPLAFGIIAGDCLQNARAALDHLVWQLAILAGKQKPNRQTSFPVCDTENAWRSKGTRNKVTSLAAEHRTAVERLQPFQIGGAARDHWLWHLNELSRIDKHQILHPVGAVNDNATFSTHPLDKTADPEPYRLGKLGQTVVMTFRASYASLEDGAEIVGWAFDPPRPDVEMQGQFSFYVTFGQGVNPGSPFPVMHVLGNILRHVEAGVIAPLARFFDHS